MKRHLPLIAGLLRCNAAFAGSAEPTVIKIVARFISPQIAPDSFAAKPKTSYIAGDRYARIEEEPDPANRIHALIIVNEPDSWMINLIDHSGRHIVDPGPTFVVHHNILEREAPKEFASFEFGKEIAFMRTHKAVPVAPREIDGSRCEG